MTPFYDYGFVRAKGGINSGRLSGVGFKLGFAHANFNSTLIFSNAISKSHLLGSQNYHENNAVFLNIGSEFGVF